MSDNGQAKTHVRSVHRVYARALVEMAEETGQLEQIAGQIEQLVEMIGENPDFRRLMLAPTLSLEQRRGIIDNVYKDRVHDLIYRLLLVLADKNRLDLGAGILIGFREVYDQLHGIVEVDAYAARPLDDNQKRAIVSAVRGAVEREVVVHEYVDESLIGGVKLRVGDQQIDASVAARLARLRNDLVAAGRQKARQEAASG